MVMLTGGGGFSLIELFLLSLSLYEVVGHYSDILGPVVRCHGVGCSELLRLK